MNPLITWEVKLESHVLTTRDEHFGTLPKVLHKIHRIYALQDINFNIMKENQEVLNPEISYMMMGSWENYPRSYMILLLSYNNC